jgi:hypothetical protein
VVYKIVFVKDGRQQEFRNDSISVIKKVHHNMKYEQHLPTSDIIKPRPPADYLFSLIESAAFKKRKRSDTNG